MATFHAFRYREDDRSLLRSGRAAAEWASVPTRRGDAGYSGQRRVRSADGSDACTQESYLPGRAG
jgi:hypothetical protein